jgi:hypothetical protein
MAQAQAKSFASILDTPSSDIERPKPMPVGQYVVIVQGQYREDKSSKKQTPFVEFVLKFIQPLDTVDEDALDAWLTAKDGTKKNLADQSIKNTYYLTDSAMWRLTDFLDHCGAGDEDMTVRQRLSETPGKELVITIKHEASDDGSSVFARVGNTAAVG